MDERRVEPEQNMEQSTGRPLCRAVGWLDVVPAVWLVLVALGYAFLALHPLGEPTAQAVPGVAALDGYVLPLLLSLLLAAIIRYFCLRPGNRRPRTAALSHGPNEGRDTP